MPVKIVLVSALLLSSFAPVHSGFGPQIIAFRVTAATASVSEREYAGPCPHRFEFTGRITVNREGTVRYRWLRSDGSASLEETLVFAAAGSREVHTSWEMGASMAVYENRWQSLEIIAPNALTSNRALFTLRCRAVAALPVYEIAGTISAGPEGNKLTGRQVRVNLRHDGAAVGSVTVTLNAAGTGTYLFRHGVFADRYHLTVERVAYAGSSGLNVCYDGVTPADRWAEPTAAAPRVAGQDFVIRWTIGWNRGPCW